MITHTLLGFEGADQVLATLGEGARRVANKALDEAAAVVAARARQLAPRRTVFPAGRGKISRRKRLYQSIVVSRTLSRRAQKRYGGKAELERFIGPTVAHAPLVEFGHRLVKHRTGRRTGKTIKVEIGRVRAHPFMRPAADQTRDLVLNIIAGRIGDAMVAEFHRQARAQKASARAFTKYARNELGNSSFVLDDQSILGAA